MNTTNSNFRRTNSPRKFEALHEIKEQTISRAHQFTTLTEYVETSFVFANSPKIYYLQTPVNRSASFAKNQSTTTSKK